MQSCQLYELLLTLDFNWDLFNFKEPSDLLLMLIHIFLKPYNCKMKYGLVEGIASIITTVLILFGGL